MPEENSPPEANSDPRPEPWITWAIIASVIAVYFVQLYQFNLHGRDVVGDALSFGHQSWAEHRYWTWITYAWAHAATMFGGTGFAWIHVAINMAFLLLFGPMLEEYLGHLFYLGLYLGGVLASAGTWFLLSTDPGESIVGASGAVFAVIAGVGTAAPKMKMDLYSIYLPTIKVTLGVIVLVLCGMEVLEMIAEWILSKTLSATYLAWLPSIGHTAHLGGAFFGFVYVTILRLIYRKNQSPVEKP